MLQIGKEGILQQGCTLENVDKNNKSVVVH